MKKPFTFRFYASLNDFLPEQKKSKSFVQLFKTPICIDDTLVSLGIPFSEVDLILVNGNPVKITDGIKENDRIAVYPKFEQFTISSISRLREFEFDETKFIADCHLGKLSKYLRMLGFDTIYKNRMDDDEIIDKAVNEKRIILTRDKLLLKSSKIVQGYFVRSILKHEQLIEVVKKFNLYHKFKSFTRCMCCNSQLSELSKPAIADKVEPNIAKLYDTFYYCSQCDKVYWKGSHFKKMENYILNLLNV
ncbi:Mut7-C RNAse domain-containing protein [Marinifilum sp. RC60d5]|uniref:Mut7-C RNAse domain-containing protein n=1 Tax=Marinifilum sp. RC60d5 TaxID=3458414 RepID=UPI004035DD18